MPTWNTAFEASPAGGDTPTQGDDRIRDLKEATRERMEKEHFFNLASGLPAEDGRHLSGAAIGYRQAAAPTLRPDGVTALDSDDAGRIWFDSDAGEFPSVYDGAAFVGFIKVYLRWSVQGTLAVQTNVLPQIIVPRAGTINKVTARADTAPTGASLLVDIFKNGSASIFDTSGDRITIAVATNEDSSDVIDAVDGVLAAEDHLEINIDQVGSTIAGSDLTITIEYSPTGT